MKNSVLLTISTMFVLSACGVPQKTYDAQVLKTKNSESRANDLQAKLSDAEKKNGESQANIDAANTAKANAEKRADSLSAELTKVRGQLNMMISRIQGMARSFNIRANAEKTVKCNVYKANVTFSPRTMFEVNPGAMNRRTNRALERQMNSKIKGLDKEIAQCYLNANLRIKKPVEAKGEFGFTINKNGKSGNAIFTWKLNNDGALVRCVNAALRKINIGKIEKPVYGSFGVHMTATVDAIPNCAPVKKVAPKKVGKKPVKKVAPKKPVKKVVKKTK